MTTTDHLDLPGVRISAQGISSLPQHGSARPPILRERIQRISLRLGRPWLRSNLALAAGFLGSAWLALAHVTDFKWGGCLVPLSVVSSVIGVFLVYIAFSRRHYLEVRTPSIIRRVSFGEHVSRGEIESFLSEAERRFGYEIVREELPKTNP